MIRTLLRSRFATAAVLILILWQTSESSTQIYSSQLTGRYDWELLFDIDNSNNSGTLTRTEEIKTSVFTSFKQMKKSLESNAISSDIGVNLGDTIYDVLNIRVEGKVNREIRSSYETIFENSVEYRKEVTKTTTYEVGPHSKLKLYRLIFSGPGVHCATDTVSSTPSPMDDVIIDVTVNQVPILKTFDIHYTRDSVSRPAGTIQMVSGHNPDINAGFGGSYVWLVPRWTRPVNEGATGLSIVIQRDENKSYLDLAHGAKGDYRYIKMLFDASSDERIIKVGLYRAQNEHDDPLENGWGHRSIDINRGRKGDYLYIVWNTRTLPSSYAGLSCSNNWTLACLLRAL